MKAIQLNTNLSQAVALDSQTLPWQASPAAGVTRKLLHRAGDEVAVATSLVRYAPGSHFARHEHAMGEEFFVLEGEFADEWGRYPIGSYVRNPWGSSHAPFTDSGCTIFVKLRQLQAEDQQRRVVDSRALPWQPGPAADIEQIPLASFGAEQTCLQRWAAGSQCDHLVGPGGAEILVISGAFEDEHGRHGPGSWLRLPEGHRHLPSSPQGGTLWLKTGHLPIQPAAPRAT